MTFHKKEVVRVSIQSDKFKVDWLDPKWAEWEAIQDSVELKALIETANKKIDQASEHEKKGKGKGKNRRME